MIEVVGNLWEYPADVRVITTNGTIKKDGSCVMGRGCAAEAKERYPDLPFILGQAIRADGNVAFWIPVGGEIIVTFPVKHQWFEKADVVLIAQSANKIAAMKALANKVVVMPRPGCGNGRLDWLRDVKPILEPILDDRFHVITFEENK